ncbi:MAG: hypothetical protein ACXVA9_02050 [Bdellovibrionales bacterium]
MSSDQTWVEALKISPESLSEWSTQVPANTPLLVWCLANGHVNVEEYLEWACDHFGIPVLNSAFFHQSFDRESLTPVREVSSWSAWCFPVGQWDDVTTVACVEPPTEMPEGVYSFVLADPAAMREVWGVTAETEAPAEKIDTPIGINPNATRTFVLNLDDASLLSEHSEVVDPNMHDQELDRTVITVVDRDIHPAPATKTPPAAAMKTPPAKTPPAPAASTTPAAKKPALAIAENTPPPAPAPRARPAAAAAANANEAKEIASSFARLHENYQSALIMHCVEGSAKPYKWDEQLPITTDDEKFNVNLGFPSFFRIVSKTMQPYHGYVIDSPAHREFFANLNFENPPACVTAVPLKAGGKLWGILVAFGGEAAQTNEALNQAITLCEKLSESLGPIWSQAA